MKGGMLACLVVGAIAGVAFHRLRGLYPEHAVLLGLAVAALAYSVLRAIDNLRGFAGKALPGNEDDTSGE